MYKKLISLLAIMAMLTCLVGCSNTADRPGMSFINKNKTAKLTIPDYSQNVTLGQYKGLTYEYPDIYIYDDSALENDVEIELESTLASLYEFREITDRPAEKLDQVTVVYKGTIDGEPFENSDSPAEGVEFTIGYETYNTDFENAVIGMNTGDTKDIIIKIHNPDDTKETASIEENKESEKSASTEDTPDKTAKNTDDTTESDTTAAVSENNTDAASENDENATNPIINRHSITPDDNTVDAKYTITLKKITRYSLPTVIDEEKLAEITDGYKTVEEYKKHLTDSFKKDYEGASENYKANQILEKVIESSTFKDLPQEEIDALVTKSVDTATKNAQSAQMSLEDFLKRYYSVNSVDEYKEQMRLTAEDYIKLKAVMCEIAKQENITITQDDIDAYEKDIREYYQLEDGVDVHQYESEEDILFECIAMKVAPLLVENNTQKTIHVDENELHGTSGE